MYARKDLAKYASGCSRIINGVVHAHGGISKRPGTYMVDTLSGGAVLLPFTYSVEQTYVLAFLDYKMRIYRNGQRVLDPESGNTVEVDTPYSLAEMPLVKFVQSADTMFLTHPHHPPTRLTRRDHHLWDFNTISFTPDTPTPVNLTATPSGFSDPSGTYVATTVYYKVAAVSKREMESMPSEAAECEVLSTWPSGAKVSLAWDEVRNCARYEVYKKSRGYYEWIGSAESNSFTDNNIEGDSSTGPKENRDPFNPVGIPSSISVTPSGFSASDVTLEVRVSSMSKDEVESSASEIVSVNIGAWGDASTVIISWTPGEGEASGYQVYVRENEGAWKSVFTDEESLTLDKDTSYDNEKPLDTPASYPGAVGIYQQRLLFGRTDAEPQTVWMSETGAFDSMAVATPLRADSAITATVDSKQMNEIRHFIPLRDVIMLTSGAEFKLSAGANSDAVSPTSVRFDLQSYWGSSEVPPVVSGTSVILAQNSGMTVRDLFYQLTEEGYAGNDVSIIAEHLINSPIKDWAYQQYPFSTIWICLESGKLLSFTYMREQQVWAWSQHESPGAAFRSVSVIREGVDDAAYFVVERGPHFYVEYQQRRKYGDPVEDAFFLDCGLSYKGVPVDTVTGADHLAGMTVCALADGSVVKNLIVTEDGKINLPISAATVHVGLPYETLIETLDPEIRSDAGALIGDKRSVVSATVELRETCTLEVGPEDDKMVQVKIKNPARYGESPTVFSGTVKTPLPGLYRDTAEVVIRSSDPLPMTVLSVMTEISVG